MCPRYEGKPRLGTQNVRSCTAYGGHADHPVIVHIGGSAS